MLTPTWDRRSSHGADSAGLEYLGPAARTMMISMHLGMRFGASPRDTLVKAAVSYTWPVLCVFTNKHDAVEIEEEAGSLDLNFDFSIICTTTTIHDNEDTNVSALLAPQQPSKDIQNGGI